MSVHPAGTVPLWPDFMAIPADPDAVHPLAERVLLLSLAGSGYEDWVTWVCKRHFVSVHSRLPTASEAAQCQSGWEAECTAELCGDDDGVAVVASYAAWKSLALHAVNAASALRSFRDLQLRTPDTTSFQTIETIPSTVRLLDEATYHLDVFKDSVQVLLEWKDAMINCKSCMIWSIIKLQHRDACYADPPPARSLVDGTETVVPSRFGSSLRIADACWKQLWCSLSDAAQGLTREVEDEADVQARLRHGIEDDIGLAINGLGVVAHDLLLTQESVLEALVTSYTVRASPFAPANTGHYLQDSRSRLREPLSEQRTLPPILLSLLAPCFYDR